MTAMRPYLISRRGLLRLGALNVLTAGVASMIEATRR
jgi:hypothetical protein